MAGKAHDVIVVGGGISGLATAYYLLKRLPSLSLLLVEASPRLGGTMQTRHVEGFIIEEGPNGFLDNKPHTLELVRAKLFCLPFLIIVYFQ